MGHKDLRLGQIVYILVFYNMSFSWLLLLEGFQFNFLLRDSENDLYIALGINECQVNITTINIKERKALANPLVQNSRPQAPCIMVFIVGSVYLVPMSQRLAYRVACSIVMVSLHVSKSTGLPSLPLLYQQRLTNIKILTAGGVAAGVVFVLKSYMCNFT